MILTLSALCIPESLANFLRRDATDLSKCSLCLLYSFCISASTLADSVWNMKVTHKCSRLKKNSSWITIMYHLISNKIKVQGINTVKKELYFVNINCYTVLPRSIAPPPRFIDNLANRQNSRLSRFPPLKIPCYTAKLSYRHRFIRHKSRKTNLNSPVSTAHNYLLTAVYWSVIMECQNWSSDTVIDLIVEGRNRWSVVLIRIITCIYFSSDYF